MEVELNGFFLNLVKPRFEGRKRLQNVSFLHLNYRLIPTKSLFRFIIDEYVSKVCAVFAFFCNGCSVFQRLFKFK